MGRSQETFGKKEREKKRQKKREEKAKKRIERKAQSAERGPDDMIAYVDEYGNVTDTPPDPTVKKVEIDPESIQISTPKKEKLEADSVRTGKVDFFDDSRGFGFIVEQGSGERYFVHVSGLIDEVVENDKVSFELIRGDRGMNAVKVKKK
jgi:cold shock CspA family protein